MQNFSAKQQEKQPSELLETLRAHLRDEQRPTPVAEPACAPEPVAAAAQPQIDLSMLQAALGGLDDEQLLSVLGQVPAHHLARALDRILTPQGAAPVQQAPSTQVPADNRNAERSRTLRAGKIIYNGKMSVNDCQIRDMSDTGCLVTLASTHGIPNHFTLHIINGDSRHECEVAWRKSDMMGLKFIG